MTSAAGRSTVPDNTISVELLTGLVLARLAPLFDEAGEPATMVYGGGDPALQLPDEPPVKKRADGTPDPSGRVAPYVWLQPSPGRAIGDDDLGDSVVDVDWWFQTTCVGGYEADVLHLVDRVRGLLYRWQPAAEGFSFGLCRPPAGYDPGVVRPDTNVKPVRYFLPLQWRIFATR